MWRNLRLFKFSDAKELLSDSLTFGKRLPWSAHIGVLCLALGLGFLFTQPKATPVITIADGRIQGNVRYSRDGYEYWEFLSIKYAMAPIGPRKFQPPVPVAPWGPEVKPTTKYPSNCLEFNPITARTSGKMDCLYLNVFARPHDPSKLPGKKPVLVYIHGGGFISGGTQMHHPEYIMDRDVVLVVMNYRLGPYGFLHLESPRNASGGAKGNMGLLDQNLALQWVQKNVGYFGGDKKRVTLIGMSAGGSSVHLHILSPKSRGLFHRAVVQSGTAVAPFAISFHPQQMAEDYAKRLGCSTQTPADLFRCFNNTDERKVVSLQDCLLHPLKDVNNFFPTVDQDFLPSSPIDILKSGHFPAIPTMWGISSGDAGVRLARFEGAPQLISQLDRDFDLVGNVIVSTKRLPRSTTTDIRQHFFGKIPNFSENVEGVMQGMVEMLNVGGFFEQHHKSAFYQAKRGAPTYLYYFNYTSNVFPGMYSLYRAVVPDQWIHSYLQIAWALAVDWANDFFLGGKGSRPYGICHGEDLFQLWNVYGWTKWFSGRDAEFSRAFVNVIVDFANFSDPLTFRHVIWPSIAGENLTIETALPHMIMDNTGLPRVIPEPHAEGRKLMGYLTDWEP